jgi:hypothetical protein
MTEAILGRLYSPARNFHTPARLFLPSQQAVGTGRLRAKDFPELRQ